METNKSDAALFNLLNSEAPKSHALTLARNAPAHVQSWFKSTFARWLAQNPDLVRQCVSARVCRSPQYRMLKALTELLQASSKQSLLFHELEDTQELPEWATVALKDHRLGYWTMPGPEANDIYMHWRDYLMTLPERDIRMTVPQVTDAVVAWDKQLARQRLLTDIKEGSELDWTPPNTELGLAVFRLTTEDSYKAEGAIMRHCVGGYWGRRNVHIFSLRSAEEERPVATIEVQIEGRRKGVAQIRGFCNKSISSEHQSLLKSWAKAKRIAWYPDWLESDEDEDEEDEWEVVDEENEPEPREDAA